jgi:hypothetical protein
MAKRAAICIGVNRAEGMTTLLAAAKGARDFADWATTQGCDVTLLVDDNGQEIFSVQLFKAVQAVVEAGIYEQLIIYFSGHGILLAPGTEYWLLSGAPQNPNEAVNLLRSVEDARNAGIPHVIFFSDACRSAVAGAPLNGVVGGSIFPNRSVSAQSGEVDVFFATRPGDPAWEVPEAEATQRYWGLFTDCLLNALRAPGSSLVEKLPGSTPAQAIITSRSLKPYLEEQVPLAAAAVHIQLQQQPQVRVETASPKYFALTTAAPASQAAGYQHEFRYIYRSYPVKGGRALVLPPVASTVRPPVVDPAREVAAAEFARETARVQARPGQLPAATTTGFTLIGTRVEAVLAPGWEIDYPAEPAQDPPAQYFRLTHPGEAAGAVEPGSILLQFQEGTGTLLAVLPGFIGVITVAEGRVLNVNYVPALTTTRFQVYRRGAAEQEKVKALVAVRARHGEFNPAGSPVLPLAAWLQSPPGFDPTLGLYVAYSYAQWGQYDELAILRRRLAADPGLPPLFDIELLTVRYQDAASSAVPRPSIVPLTPLLTQGWALLTPGNSLYQPLHAQLRAHLLPALWTTYTAQGVALAHAALQHSPTT